MLRVAPPPDFRYVGLEPGPTALATGALAAGFGTTAFGAGVLASGGSFDALVVAAAGAIGGVTAWLAARRIGAGGREPAGQRASMAIVPWGVLVRTDTDDRVLRWPAVEGVDVSFVGEFDNATPTIRWSVVTIRTARELWCGRTAGTAPLERLEALLREYADEASSSIALDLDGEVAVDETSLEPTFEQLLAEARRLLRTGAVSDRLSVPPASYRNVTGDHAETETMDALTTILRGGADAPADPRPLAAILGAELGSTPLLEPIARLATSPHPLVAAVARAAALKLGGDVKNVGGVCEVSEFLPEDDVRQLEEWIACG